MSDDFRNFMSTKRFDVEQAIALYATSHVLLPAHELYSENLDSILKGLEKKCHIYLVGKCPKVDFVAASREGDDLNCEFKSRTKHHVLTIHLPEGLKLIEGEEGYFLLDDKGEKIFPSTEYMFAKLATETNFCDFEVVYIGQAFGRDGKRNALDRLKKHETLQRIALTTDLEGYYLNTILLDVHSNQSIFTMFNPWAKEQESEQKRFMSGYDLVRNMSGEELVTIYEAALIRYFEPKFNKVFKDSFPSTYLECLKNCYRKDINSVIAEINFDMFPFRLWSHRIPPNSGVIAKFDLHTDEDRRVFFSQV
jgi:hypothetical protein